MRHHDATRVGDVEALPASLAEDVAANATARPIVETAPAFTVRALVVPQAVQFRLAQTASAIALQIGH